MGDGFQNVIGNTVKWDTSVCEPLLKHDCIHEKCSLAHDLIRKDPESLHGKSGCLTKPLQRLIKRHSSSVEILPTWPYSLPYPLRLFSWETGLQELQRRPADKNVADIKNHILDGHKDLLVWAASYSRARPLRDAVLVSEFAGDLAGPAEGTATYRRFRSGKVRHCDLRIARDWPSGAAPGTSPASKNRGSPKPSRAAHIFIVLRSMKVLRCGIELAR